MSDCKRGYRYRARVVFNNVCYQQECAREASRWIRCGELVDRIVPAGIIPAMHGQIAADRHVDVGQKPRTVANAQRSIARDLYTFIARSRAGADVTRHC